METSLFMTPNGRESETRVENNAHCSWSWSPYEGSDGDDGNVSMVS